MHGWPSLGREGTGRRKDWGDLGDSERRDWKGGQKHSCLLFLSL